MQVGMMLLCACIGAVLVALWLDPPQNSLMKGALLLAGVGMIVAPFLMFLLTLVT